MIKKDRLAFLFACAIAKKSIKEADALSAYLWPDKYLLFYYANMIRERYFGQKIKFCSIINARSGRCPEDCRFCAQSSFYKTGVPIYPLMPESAILRAAREAKKNGATGFSIVTSGPAVTGRVSRGRILRAVEKISSLGLYTCVSLGKIDRGFAGELKSAGLKRYHHNLETSRRMFGKICTTHSYDEKLSTLCFVKEAGLELCSGGIFGLGETERDRIELAFTLKKYDVSSIPLNFLNPLKGTPLACAPPVSPMDILRTIAVYRFIFPDRDIKVCGGRERNLRDLQSWIYYAGANGSMLGNYLTTNGRPVEDDLNMVKDLGLMVQHGI